MIKNLLLKNQMRSLNAFCKRNTYGEKVNHNSVNRANKKEYYREFAKSLQNIT